MAENKKSFILYCDLIHTIEKMPKEKAGELFLHILQYVNDKNPVTDDLIVNLTFEPIKQTLKRDLVKWEKFIEKQRENGLKGGRPKNQTNPNNPTLILANPTKPKKADNVSDSVNVNEIKKNNIDSRKLKFASTLEPFLQTYGREMLNSFYAYWTEPNKSNTKFKQELEKTWDLKRRLETWASNDKNFKKTNQQSEPIKIVSTINYGKQNN